MAKRLSYSALLLAWSVAPAFAGGSGSDEGTGLVLLQTVKHLLDKLASIGWF